MSRDWNNRTLAATPRDIRNKGRQKSTNHISSVLADSEGLLYKGDFALFFYPGKSDNIANSSFINRKPGDVLYIKQSSILQKEEVFIIKGPESSYLLNISHSSIKQIQDDKGIILRSKNITNRT